LFERLGFEGIWLEDFLRQTNPWWAGNPLPPLPPYRRWLFADTLRRLQGGLAPITALRGPRQVGKTTLQEQIIEHLLRSEGVPPQRIFRVQFDQLRPLTSLPEPILSLCRWYEQEVLRQPFNELARAGQPAFLFFDEVQNVADWAPQVKALVDHHSVRVLLTGSSALRIARGGDSLAGRVSTIEVGPLLLREIAALRGWGGEDALLPSNGLEALRDRDFWIQLREHGLRNPSARDQAFAAFSERGGYPIAQVRDETPWEEMADYLNEMVVGRMIQHDFRLGEGAPRPDEGLVVEVFRLCCRYAGQAPGPSVFTPELRFALGVDVNWQRVLTYLRFLNDTLLIRLVPPLEIRVKSGGRPPKICLSDHSLRASWLREVVPLSPEELDRSPHLANLAGHLAESTVGYYLGTIPNLEVAWFPERPGEPEVDFVLTVGRVRIPLEVKYRRQIDPHRDTLGLRAFLEKTVNNAPFGLLVTLTDEVTVADPRIIALPLSSLLLMR